MSEKNLEFKKLELMTHCAVGSKVEDLNKLMAEFHGALFPWKQITSTDENQALLDDLKENY